MAYLLEVAEGPGRRGIRPRSLKVATISALMTEAAKGQANLPKLAIQGNYRAVAAQDMAKVYSRNIAHQLFVSGFEQFSFRKERYFRFYKRGSACIFGEPSRIGNVSTRNRISGIKTGGLGYYSSSEKGEFGRLEKGKGCYYWLPSRRTLSSQMSKTTQSNTPILTPLE